MEPTPLTKGGREPNGVKGHSALQLSRDLDCQYKTAFVLTHKLREALGAEINSPDQPELSGTYRLRAKAVSVQERSIALEREYLRRHYPMFRHP